MSGDVEGESKWKVMDKDFRRGTHKYFDQEIMMVFIMVPGKYYTFWGD